MSNKDIAKYLNDLIIPEPLDNSAEEAVLWQNRNKALCIVIKEYEEKAKKDMAFEEAIANGERCPEMVYYR